MQRSNRVAVLGACFAAVVVAVVILAIAPIASGASAQMAVGAPGASCANPEVGGEQLLPTLTSLSFTPRIDILQFPNGDPTTTEWSVPAGYFICATRLQLADGSVASPTYVFPTATPTPIGGQYDETAGDPGSALATITVTAAKSPVLPGASCDYPQESTLTGTVSHAGPKSHVSVNVVEVSPTRLRLKLKPHKADLVLCPKAYIFLRLINAAGIPARRLVFPVSVKPHGGLSSTVTVPAGSYTRGEELPLIEAAAFARVVTSHG
jgi:hypothetical protein